MISVVSPTRSSPAMAAAETAGPRAAGFSSSAAASRSSSSSSSKMREDRITLSRASSPSSPSSSRDNSEEQLLSPVRSTAGGAQQQPSPRSLGVEQQQQSTTTPPAFQRRREDERGAEAPFPSPTKKSTTTQSPRNQDRVASTSSSIADGGAQQHKLHVDPSVLGLLTTSTSSLGHGRGGCSAVSVASSSNTKRSKLRLPLSPIGTTRTATSGTAAADPAVDTVDRVEGERERQCRSLPSHGGGGGLHLEKKKRHSSTVSSSSSSNKEGMQQMAGGGDPAQKSATTTTTSVADADDAPGAIAASASLSMSSKASLTLRSRRRSSNKARTTPSGRGSATSASLSARYAQNHSPTAATSSSSTRPPTAVIVTSMDTAAATAAAAESSSLPTTTAAAAASPAAVASSSALQNTPCMAYDVTTNSNLMLLSAATSSLVNDGVDDGSDDGDCHHEQPAKKAATTTNSRTISTVGRFIDILNEKQELLNILKEQQQNHNNNNNNNDSSLHHVESRSTMSPILHSYRHRAASAATTANINKASSENDEMEGIVSLLDDVTLADLSRYIDAVQAKEDSSSLVVEGDDDDQMDHENNDEDNDGPGMALTKLPSPRATAAVAASNCDPGSTGISSHKNNRKSRSNSDSSSSHRLEDTLAVVQDFIDSKKQQQKQQQQQQRQQHPVEITTVQSTSFNEGDVDAVEPAALAAVSSFLDALANVREARKSTEASSGNDDHHTYHNSNNNSRSEADACDKQRHEAVRSRKLILVNTEPATGAAGHKFVLVNTGPSQVRDGGDEKTVATEEVSEPDNDNSTAAGAVGAVDPDSSKGAAISSSSGGISGGHSENRESGSSSSSSRRESSGQAHRSKTHGMSATATSHPSRNQELIANTTAATPPTPLISATEMAVGVSNASHRGGTSTGSHASGSSRPRSNAHGTMSSKATATSRQSNSKRPIRPPATLDLVKDTTAAVVPVVPSVNVVGPSDVVSLLSSLASTPRRSREEEGLYKQLLKLRDKAGRRRRDDGHSFTTEDLLPETLAMIEAYIEHIQVTGSASDTEEDINVPVETSNEISDFIDLLTAKKQGKQQHQHRHANAPVSIRVKKDPPSASELKLEKEKEVVKVAKDPPIKDTLSAEFERYVSGNRAPEINPAKREPPTGTGDMKGNDDTHSGQLVVPSETLATHGSTFSRSPRQENLGDTRASTQKSRRESPIEPEIVELLSDDDGLSTSSTGANSGFGEDDTKLIADMLELSTCASSSNNASEGHAAPTQKRLGKERSIGTGSTMVNRHIRTKSPRGHSSLGFDPLLKATSRSQPPSPEAKHRIRSPPVSPGRNILVIQAEEKKREDPAVEEDPLLENEVFLRLSEAVQIPMNDIDQQIALAAVTRNAYPHFQAFPPTRAKLYEILVDAAEVGLSSQVAGRFIKLAQAQLRNRLDGASPDDHRERRARNRPNDDSVAHDADIIAFLCRLLKMVPVVFKSIQEESTTSAPSRSPSRSQQSESGQEAFEVDLEHGLIEEKNSGDSEDEGPWWETAAKLTSKSWKYYQNASEDESDQDPVSDSERSSSIDRKRSCRQMRQVKKTRQQTLALADLSESRSDYTSAGENMINPMSSPTNRPMSNRSVADEEMNYFWHSRQDMRERRLQFRNRNRKSYVQLPNLNTASFSRIAMEESSPSKNRRLRAGVNYESEEEGWLAKRSMAKWGRKTPWNDPTVLFVRSKETVYPVQDPKPINGVDSAKSLYAASAIWKSRRQSGLGCQWYQSYGIRTQGHTGFFDIDVFSLYEASVARARRHPQDKVAWEYRHVKQRFLYEHSLFSRNWFGDLDEKLVGPIVRYPICQPKSMEMPMRAPEWSPEWYRGPYLAPLGSNLSGASFQEAIPGYLRDEIEEYDQDAWEETPECGTFKNTKPQLKCGERITLVTPDLASSLRRSRWRKKYFPKGTFPY